MAKRRRDKRDDPQPELARVVHRNIHAMLQERRRLERIKPFQERVADRITAFTGSMWFVYAHIAGFCFWLLWNTGSIPNHHRFDPYPFALLATVVSMEAIFLTSFVLISQNRMQKLESRRADLDLQINLLSEHEVTRLIALTEALARHLQVEPTAIPNVEELKKDVQPEKVLKEIEAAHEQEQTQ